MIRGNEEFLSQYRGWDSVLKKLLALILEGKVKKWKSYTHDFLETWARGNFALVGDACYRYCENNFPMDTCSPEIVLM